MLNNTGQHAQRGWSSGGVIRAIHTTRAQRASRVVRNQGRHLLGRIIMIDGFISRISVMDRAKAHNRFFSNTQAPSSTDPATKNVRSNRTPALFLHAAPSARHGNAGIPVLATPKPHRGIEEGLSGSKTCLIAQHHTHSRVLGGLLCIARGPKSKKISSTENRPCSSVFFWFLADMRGPQKALKMALEESLPQIS